MPKTCYFLGREIIDANNFNDYKEKLRLEIEKAIIDGFYHFVSSMDNHAEKIFAYTVFYLKERHPLTIEAVIPYKKQLSDKNQSFQRVLKLCDIVRICSDRYEHGCENKRDRFMIDHSQRLIIIGGKQMTGEIDTALNYAKKLKKEINIIDL